MCKKIFDQKLMQMFCLCDIKLDNKMIWITLMIINHLRLLQLKLFETFDQKVHHFVKMNF